MTAILFIVCVTVLWSLVLWNTFVALSGFRFHQRRVRRRAEIDARVVSDEDLPGLSVLIPAHNEGHVMARSLENLLRTDYPADRLEILVIDDASTDATAEICDRFASSDTRVRVIHVPSMSGGKGKSAALNRALRLCRFPYVAIYDADNRPHPDALRRLVSELIADPERLYAAAVGRIMKFNRRATLLNRFCSFEFSAFQWGVQAGLAQLFDLVMITGTNFVVEADAIRALDGWDVDALTEDLELSIRLYAAGRRVCFVPEAVSEEQDPQTVRAWFKQRTRWMTGNYYVVRKHWRTALRASDLRVRVAVSLLTFVYGFFLFFLVLSDAIAIAGVAGMLHFDLHGPYITLWLVAFGVFLATFQLTQALEGEDRVSTPLVAALMYVSYTQLWLIVAARSLARAAAGNQRFVWETTPRSHA